MSLIKAHIPEYNTWIAEYMDDDGEFAHDREKAGTIETLHYHDDWLWLMPAVEYIEYNSKPEVRFVMFPDECQVQKLREDDDGCFHTYITVNDIDRLGCVYQGVVEYLRIARHET